MEHAKLLVHRGATSVTREELADIQAPRATATWKPIQHAVLVNTIHEEVTPSRYCRGQGRICRPAPEQHALWGHGPQLAPD